MTRYADLFRKNGGHRKTVSPPPETAVEETASREAFTLLFVDDEEAILKSLVRIFAEENYEILTASSADEALELLDRQNVHLVITDHRMPGMTGAEMLKILKERWPETIRIMLTGYADVQSIMGAVNEGAVYKFITKPWNDEDLRLTVSLALQQYVLMQENRRLREITKDQEVRIRKYSSLFDENRGVMGSLLVRAEVITETDLETARRERRAEEFLGETFVRLGFATEPVIVKVLQTQLNVDSLDLRELNVTPGVARFLPGDVCETNRLIPVKFDGRELTIAMADPSDIVKIDNIEMMTGLKVVPVVAPASAIMRLVREIFGASDADGDGLEILSELDPIDEIDIVIEEEEDPVSVRELLESSDIPPIVRIVNAVISEAIRYRSSDVHIEPKAKYTLVRFRIDGMLHAKIKIPPELHAATVSRIKILGKLDIAERRKPQDGRITVKAGTGMVDIRVSTLPTINGEKIVMRILDKSAAIKGIDELGVLPDDLAKITKLIRKPQGIIIATGPTGSGKTTMLYSILNTMMEGSRNFETIEDPVEYFLEDANQVFVYDKIGLSFASVLRSTLRQDPDVILVGEIRDPETGDVAFKAALSGHMVLTTLHTNHSVASITRLMNMGTEPYLIASALEGILAQRLVRHICPHCRTEVEPAADTLDLLKISAEMFDGKVYAGSGCERCNQTGYAGRIGIFETFIMNDDFRHFIASEYQEAKLMDMARATGMRTLIEDATAKVRRGETTLDEVLRVIGAQTRYERTCPACHREVEGKYLFCPFCGEVKRNFCLQCMTSLEEGWLNCPFCGKSKT